MKGCILCILDGMTHLGFTAPPALASYQQGFFSTTPQGHPTESLPCILSLLGVPDADVPHYARGWLEAVGNGIAVNADDLIMRTTWVRTAPPHAGAAQRVLAYAIPESMPKMPESPQFYPMGGYKGLLVFSHLARLVPQIQTFAPHACLGQPLRACLPIGLPPVPQPLAAENIYLMPWGEACPGALPSLANAAYVGGTALVRGIAVQMKLHIAQKGTAVHGLTGEVDTDLAAKYAAALGLARQGKLVLLHINGADEAAHRKAAKEKAAFTARALQACALPLLQSELPVLVTADHGTNPADGLHVTMPQPFFANFEVATQMQPLHANCALALLRTAQGKEF